MSPLVLWQLCLPLGLSSQDCICSLGITLACPSTLLRAQVLPLNPSWLLSFTLSDQTFLMMCSKEILVQNSWCCPLLSETFLSGDRHWLSRWRIIMTVNNIYWVLLRARHLLITCRFYLNRISCCPCCSQSASIFLVCLTLPYCHGTHNISWVMKI